MVQQVGALDAKPGHLISVLGPTWNPKTSQLRECLPCMHRTLNLILIIAHMESRHQRRVETREPEILGHL